MAVTVTEKVYLWLRENGITTDNTNLYAAFPDTAKGNLRNIKKRFMDGQQPKRMPDPKPNPIVTDVTNSRLQAVSTISEALIEQSLAQCLATNPDDPRVIALAIQWLDKKKAIQPTRNDEIEEQNAYTQEYRSIQDEIFTTSDIDEID